MEEAKTLLAELSENSYDKETIYLIEVTHINTPFNFYVSLVKYKPIVKFLESIEPKTKPTHYKLEDLVVFNMDHWTGGHRYIRGRIKRFLRMKNYILCDLFAIDYGFTKKYIPIQLIWKCSELALKTPPLALDCQLANCYPFRPKGFSHYTINIFKYYTTDEVLRMKIVSMKPKISKYLVALVNSFPESIATLIAISGTSVLGHFRDIVSWNPIIGRKILNFTFRKFSIDEKLHVRVLAGNSLKEFHVARVSDYKEHLEEIGVISYYAKREFNIAPRHLIEGSLVCVKIENIFERAFIKKVTQPKVSAICQLVDCGRDEEFLVSEIKYMARSCLRTPVLSIYCKTEENQAWDNGLDSFLSPGFEFNITIKRLGHEFECPNEVDISALVTDEGYDEARALPDNIVK